MKTIYLFRHGEVEDAYRTRVRGGATDCLLSPEGEAMSVANAQFIARAGIQAVVTTGMRRTDFVGELLSREHGIPHRVDVRLREMLLGVWEGAPLAELKAAHPAEAAQFSADPLCGAFPGLEDATAFQGRVLDAWAQVLAHDEERIGVVAHGITNTVILRAVAGDIPYALNQTIGCMNEIAVMPPPRIVQANVVLYPESLRRSGGR